VGVPTTQLAGGVNLTSVPLVIPVANGTRLYGRCQETAAIQEVLERTETRETSLTGELASLSSRMSDLRSRGKFAEYNQLLDQYGSVVEDYNDNALVHNYILENQDDRKGTYTWLRARAAL